MEQQQCETRRSGIALCRQGGEIRRSGVRKAWEGGTAWMAGALFTQSDSIATVAFDAQPGSNEAATGADGSSRNVVNRWRARETGVGEARICHTRLIRCRRGVGSQIGSRCGSRRPYAVVYSC